MKKIIQNSKRGFTLVEMLLVIAVIVILSGVTIVGIRAMIDNANKNAAAVELHAGCWYVEDPNGPATLPGTNTKIRVVDRNTPGAQYYSDMDAMYAEVRSIQGTVPDANPEHEHVNTPNDEPAYDWEANDKKWNDFIQDLKNRGCPDDKIIVVRNNEGHIVSVSTRDWDDTVNGNNNGSNSNTGSNTGNNTGSNTGNNNDSNTGNNQGNTGNNTGNGDANTGSNGSGNTGDSGNTGNTGSNGSGNNNGSGNTSSAGANGGTVTLNAPSQYNLQAQNQSFSGNGQPIKKLTITISDGAEFTTVSAYDNGGKYTMSKSSDNKTVTITFNSSLGWASPESALKVGNIQWSGSQNVKITYGFEYM